YDVLGNLIETIYPDNSVTRSTYDEKNRPVYTQERAVPASGVTTAPSMVNLYDLQGRVTRVERRSNVQLTRQTDSMYSTEYTMSVTSTGALVSCTRNVYDLNSRIQFSMDARGAVTEFQYDVAGRRTNVLVYTNYVVSPTATGSISPSG